mmetsp:Transcript_12854/g.30499  ORF Transcript_12854/g.30499 Transcript_12854/m.30499 type:complete len:369 (+) Transcript_12854:3271-4377(+)
MEDEVERREQLQADDPGVLPALLKRDLEHGELSEGLDPCQGGNANPCVLLLGPRDEDVLHQRLAVDARAALLPYVAEELGEHIRRHVPDLERLPVAPVRRRRPPRAGCPGPERHGGPRLVAGRPGVVPLPQDQHGDLVAEHRQEAVQEVGQENQDVDHRRACERLDPPEDEPSIVRLGRVHPGCQLGDEPRDVELGAVAGDVLEEVLRVGHSAPQVIVRVRRDPEEPVEGLVHERQHALASDVRDVVQRLHRVEPHPAVLVGDALQDRRHHLREVLVDVLVGQPAGDGGDAEQSALPLVRVGGPREVLDELLDEGVDLPGLPVAHEPLNELLNIECRHLPPLIEFVAEVLEDLRRKQLQRVAVVQHRD